ncbi:hypothetical protein BD311DRAFT_653099 [Dichomitus squalens]|uniref:DUF6533 domain-containing protein n=1 Tax=Dichomitus squalens TaxID=114155 RepID=A0A4V2K1J4_9APHY|nr:hypothetical protein BD311DRAFT_653099 [Dichomitus squalens]
MSVSDSSDLIAELASIQVGNFFAVAGAGLIVYEFMITFNKEVDLFWKRKITLSSILFLLNRYLPLIVNMIYAPWPFSLSPTTYENSCKALIYTAETLEIFQYLPWAVFSGLRAYVLSSRAWPLALFVFVLSLAPVVINYVTLGYAEVLFDATLGCGVTSPLTDAVQQDCACAEAGTCFTVVSRVCLITSDLLVLAITWMGTYKDSREMKLLGQTTSLSSILFRDGIMYFLVLLIMNTLHLSFSLRSILNQNNENNASYITILTEPITAILISRFLMDLQDASNGKGHQHSLSSVQLGQIGTLDFNGIIGSLGSTLAAPGEGHPFEPASTAEDSSATRADGLDSISDSGAFSEDTASRTINSC